MYFIIMFHRSVVFHFPRKSMKKYRSRRCLFVSIMSRNPYFILRGTTIYLHVLQFKAIYRWTNLPNLKSHTRTPIVMFIFFQSVIMNFYKTEKHYKL